MRRLLAVCLAAAASAAAAEQAPSLAAILEQAGERVERYFARAQSIMCLEIVHLQPLNTGLTSDGFGRTVESELRLSWEPGRDGTPSAEAQTLRQLLKVNGRKPRKNDWNNCTTPEQETRETQVLSLLLPAQREEYRFSYAGESRIDRRRTLLVDYRLIKPATVESSMVEGRDDCVSFDVDGGLQGRIWIDAETFDVLRIDQRLTGYVEIPVPRKARQMIGTPSTWTMERWDTTTRFKPMTFQNPDETLMLPESQTSLRITRGSGQPRLRTTTNYRNYQRFVTGARVVEQ